MVTIYRVRYLDGYRDAEGEIKLFHNVLRVTYHWTKREAYEAAGDLAAPGVQQVIDSRRVTLETEWKEIGGST
jgi:hypothetical protein